MRQPPAQAEPIGYRDGVIADETARYPALSGWRRTVLSGADRSSARLPAVDELLRPKGSMDSASCPTRRSARRRPAQTVNAGSPHRPDS